MDTVSSLSLLEVIAHVNVLAEFSCFPHVVNLDCKAILSAISKLDYSSVNLDDSATDDDTFMDSLKQDPIAAIQVLIKVVLIFLFDTDAIFIRFVHHHFINNTFLSFLKLLIRKISNFCKIWKSDGHQHY